MTKGLARAIAVGLTCLATSAHAQQESRTKEYRACTEASQNGIGPCISDEIARQDARLNSNYQRIMRRIDAKRGAKLRESERLWIRFRDLTCDAISLVYEGGSMEGQLYGECQIDQRVRRNRDLQTILTEGEGDFYQ